MTKKRTTVRSAEELAKGQREISVAEFFAKNRHLLGFDNPKKALLTTIKEAVDNALDACEEAGILPEVEVKIERVKTGAPAEESGPVLEGAGRKIAAPSQAERFRITVRDNGPGIVRAQIPKIFGKLLYGSKFHRLKQSRGQQGIGISAAAMYGQMTTGAATRIVSRTSPKKKAYRFVIRIDTKANDAKVIKEEEIDWEYDRGTQVEIDLEGIFQRGARSVEAYLEGTVVANPHVTLRYVDPDGNKHFYPRAAEELPEEPAEIKPHPYGVELGRLMEMLHDTKSRNLSAFFRGDFSRVGPSVVEEICKKAGVPPSRKPSDVTPKEAERIHRAIGRTKIMAPPTNCLAPVGEELLLAGLSRLVKADFTTAVSRRPTVYRGNPFLIEAALAWGGALPPEEPATLFRFANRVPLLYQQGACAVTKAVVETNWRSYGLSQPKGSLPVGPLVVLVHIASAWVPFTSEAKEAIASYPEIVKEMRLALQECGRRLGRTLRRRAREAEAARKKDYIKMYLPQLVVALGEILDLSEREKKKTEQALGMILEKKSKRRAA